MESPGGACTQKKGGFLEPHCTLPGAKPQRPVHRTERSLRVVGMPLASVTSLVSRPRRLGMSGVAGGGDHRRGRDPWRKPTCQRSTPPSSLGFCPVLQTLLIQTVHLYPPTLAAPVQPVLQAIPAAAPVSVQALLLKMLICYH